MTLISSDFWMLEMEIHKVDKSLARKSEMK